MGMNEDELKKNPVLLPYWTSVILYIWSAILLFSYNLILAIQHYGLKYMVLIFILFWIEQQLTQLVSYATF